MLYKLESGSDSEFARLPSSVICNAYAMLHNSVTDEYASITILGTILARRQQTSLLSRMGNACSLQEAGSSQDCKPSLPTK